MALKKGEGLVLFLLIRLLIPKIFSVGCKEHASISRQTHKTQILGLHFMTHNFF